MEEKTKNLEESNIKIEELKKEKEIAIEQKNDLLYRLTEKMNQNDDLNEKIRRLEHMLSALDKSYKDFNLNSYNGGVLLDFYQNENGTEVNEEEHAQDVSKDIYTINMNINLKKNKIGNYGMNRNNDDKRKRTLLEISELMHHKPISKV